MSTSGRSVTSPKTYFIQTDEEQHRYFKQKVFLQANPPSLYSSTRKKKVQGFSISKILHHHHTRPFHFFGILRGNGEACVFGCSGLTSQTVPVPRDRSSRRGCRFLNLCSNPRRPASIARAVCRHFQTQRVEGWALILRTTEFNCSAAHHACRHLHPAPHPCHPVSHPAARLGWNSHVVKMHLLE